MTQTDPTPMMSGPISERKPLVQIGAVLGGKYKVERVIAEGGMGIVVRALNIDLGSRFAVKVLHPDLKNDETAFARFLQEARGVAKLKSEHIVQMIDVSSKDGELPFMVMELLEGIDLDALVQLQGQLAPKVAAELTRQACNGVSCAHKAGIMHRDLKPANLFLSKKPSGDAVVKVLDFGLMKIKPERGESVKLTRPKEVFGTPSYMSPEQINGEILDERTDVWSLGAIFYELVTGRSAFGAETVAQTLVNISIHQPPTLDTFAADVPSGMQEIVNRALSKDRNDRYATVDELMEAIAPFAGEVSFAPLLPDRPVSIAPPPAPAPPPQLEIDIGQSLKLPPPRAAMTTMPTLEPSKGGTKRFVFVAVAIGAIIGGLLAAFLLNGNGGATTESPAPSASIVPAPDRPRTAPNESGSKLQTSPPPSSSIPHASVDSLPMAPARAHDPPPAQTFAPVGQPTEQRPATTTAPEKATPDPTAKPTVEPYPEFGRRK